MPETIYTIPINEAYENIIETGENACPFCKLKNKLEEDELEIILGASMMEPDIRIRTNELGFCPNHFSKMLRFSKRLPLALILESHLDEVKGNYSRKGLIKPSAEKIADAISKLSESCYVCSRIEYNEKRLISNAVYMWQSDYDFRKKYKSASMLCLPHTALLLKCAKHELNKRDYADFAEITVEITGKCLADTKEDVSTFVRSYDYRYAGDPLSEKEKLSVETAIRLLSGE